VSPVGQRFLRGRRRLVTGLFLDQSLKVVIYRHTGCRRKGG
jgi:hypothetical protein